MIEVIIAQSTLEQTISEVQLVILGVIALFCLFFIGLEIFFGSDDKDEDDDDHNNDGGIGVLNYSCIPVV